MVPGIYNFPNQYRGDTFDAVAFTFRDKDTSNPIDLTGTTIKCQFREPFTKKVIKEINDGSGITVLDAIGGQIAIDAFLIDWDEGVFNYDIQMTLPGGELKTYVKGSVTVVSDTTR